MKFATISANFFKRFNIEGGLKYRVSQSCLFTLKFFSPLLILFAEVCV